MKKLVKKSLLALCLCVSLNLFSQGLKMPALSPKQTLIQEFGTSKITIEYSRPSVKNRDIFGQLVQYGKVWRTGANAATSIEFGADVKVNNTIIKAGKYGLVSIPNDNNWDIIITKQLNIFFDKHYDATQDVVKFSVPVKKLSSKIETFTISINDIIYDKCHLHIEWNDVCVSFEIQQNDIDVIISNSISDVMYGKDNQKEKEHSYFSAATYYIEKNKDLNQALEWLNSAEKLNEKAFWVLYQKALCLKKLNKKTEALSVAEKSLKLATDDKNHDFIKMNEELIVTLK